ncbi:uncharacterized protein L201_003148 [Kwoniella dendrophila CBS 6074]|uniref:Uncharacterized protein n=1 Tax=Kwoniella dendrophila CBS 6074 TaxID=1295534 RepID=A0AAX4JUL4_9TREE
MSSDQASKTQRQRQAWADDVRLKAELNIFTMEYSDASISDQRKREMLSQALEKGYISQAEAARYEQLLNGGASKISEAKFCNEESSVQSGPKTEVKAEPSPPGSKVGKKTSSCTLL